MRIGIRGRAVVALSLALACAIGLAQAPSERDGKLLPMKLEHGVTINMPVDWIASNSAGRQAMLGKMMSTSGDAERIARGESTTTTLLARHVGPQPFGTSVRIVSQPHNASEINITTVTEDDLRAYSKQAETLMSNTLRSLNMELLKLSPLRRVKLAGRPALFSEAVETTPRGNLYVRQYIVATSDHNFHVTFQMQDSERATWMPMVELMERSIKLAD
jgi:hypothetical protein